MNFLLNPVSQEAEENLAMQMQEHIESGNFDQALRIVSKNKDSFKQIDLKGRVPFMYILALVLVLVLIALRPSVVLFVLAFIYASSGPVMTLLLIRRHRAKRRMQDGS